MAEDGTLSERFRPTIVFGNRHNLRSTVPLRSEGPYSADTAPPDVDLPTLANPTNAVLQDLKCAAAPPNGPAPPAFTARAHASSSHLVNPMEPIIGTVETLSPAISAPITGTVEQLDLLISAPITLAIPRNRSLLYLAGIPVSFLGPPPTESLLIAMGLNGNAMSKGNAMSNGNVVMVASEARWRALPDDPKVTILCFRNFRHLK
ncbi:hypothetical protein FN846DRAFT_893792 [Sphaerosporella brunnea]|uniref:Uncharacterized protein n=1 Tax=Sphaerosporella brunnea TaxID=1250544 RepID=A0A5J5EL54_9PEZI|nr:hypothetical protein FN846DRAFT_893792 [Sphaerosporella brunnea]